MGLLRRSYCSRRGRRSFRSVAWYGHSLGDRTTPGNLSSVEFTVARYSTPLVGCCNRIHMPHRIRAATVVSAQEHLTNASGPPGPQRYDDIGPHHLWARDMRRVDTSRLVQQQFMADFLGTRWRFFSLSGVRHHRDTVTAWWTASRNASRQSLASCPRWAATASTRKRRPDHDLWSRHYAAAHLGVDTNVPAR